MAKGAPKFYNMALDNKGSRISTNTEDIYLVVSSLLQRDPSQFMV